MGPELCSSDECPPLPRDTLKKHAVPRRVQRLVTGWLGECRRCHTVAFRQAGTSERSYHIISSFFFCSYRIPSFSGFEVVEVLSPQTFTGVLFAELSVGHADVVSQSYRAATSARHLLATHSGSRQFRDGCRYIADRVGWARTTVSPPLFALFSTSYNGKLGTRITS